MKARKSALQQPSETQKALISTLDNDIKHILCKDHLSGTDSFSLFRTSRLFGPAKEIIAQREDHPLRKLLSHGALGELDAAEAIWMKDPSLLTFYGTVYHPNYTYQKGQAPIAIPVETNPGRYKYVNCTFWQILLMNEEYEEAEEVGKFMTEEEKQKQFAEIFPDGEIKKYNWDLEKAEKLLQVVFDEVIKDPLIDENDLSQMSESTRKARQAFIDYVKPGEHKIGLVSDAKLYVKALKLYEEKSDKFINRSQLSFWNIKMEEWLADCLGTGYLRPHSQGIGNPLKRIGCVLADNSSYFAFRRPLNFIPASHFFVGYYGGSPWGGGGRSAGAGFFFSELMSSKNESKDRLYAAICAPRSIGMSDSLK